MRTLTISTAMALFALLGLAGCSDDTVTKPQPPAVREGEYQYSVRFSNSEGAFTVKRVEYADPTGYVKVVPDPLPMWSRTMTFKTGDRMYVRAEFEYEGAFWAAIQIQGPDGLYYKSECERVDGPNTCIVEIDRIVE